MFRRTFFQTGAAVVPLLHAHPLFRILNLSAYDMKPLRRNVGYFFEQGGTIGWLMQKDGIVVIDAQFPEQAGHLIDELKKMPDAPIEYLINTHHHRDHTSGNVAFKGLAKNILAHENSKRNQENSAKANDSEASQLYPNELYTERWQKQIGDEMIDIQYWGPAHTNGDSVIHFQNANVVHCGDLIFNRRYPYIDKGAGAMIENWIDSLQLLQTYFDNDTIYIFGHSRVGHPVTGTKADIAAFMDYLTALMEFVSREIQAGKSREEIMKATAIPGADEWQGDGIERSLSAALQELGVE